MRIIRVAIRSFAGAQDDRRGEAGSGWEWRGGREEGAVDQGLRGSGGDLGNYSRKRRATPVTVMIVPSISFPEIL